MKRLLFLILLFLMLVGIKNANAQIDTIFWFSAPWITPDHTGIKPVAFRFSTFNNTTTIRIQQPAATYDTTFIVPPNTLYSKYLGFMLNQVESKPANQVLTTGFKITSDYPITAVYDIVTEAPTHYNPETYSLKGQNGMGTEFVLPFQTLWRNRPSTSDNNGDGVTTQPYQQFSVVASENNTTIYITPKTDIVGHPAGITFSVFLPNKGDVWVGQNIYQDLGTPGHNLAGTIVVSDKPVSITVCEDSVQAYPVAGCADEIGDQIVPVDVLGLEYIVNKGHSQTNVKESIFITATKNFTAVTINDGTTTNVLLNKGDTYAYTITQPLTHVQADKAVVVYHMSGWGCEFGAAILPPLNCAGSDQVSFARSNSQNFLINILCKSGEEGAFQLNGDPTLIPSTAFSVVPGTGGNWMGAQIQYTTAQIPAGSSNLVTNSLGKFALGVINGDGTSGVLYHYLSSFIRKVHTDAGTDTTLCSGTSNVILDGSVTGGVTSGKWKVLNGAGNLIDPTKLSTSYTPTNSDFTQGELTFVLTSTGNCDPVRDTMRVTFIPPPKTVTDPNMTFCKNNAGAIPIVGTVDYAVGGKWTGGYGGSFGNTGDLSTTYTPSSTDLTKDSIVLYLESQGSLYSCPNDIDSIVIHFTPSPVVKAGIDQYICSSISTISLNGTISGGTTTGGWSTSGSGSFSPSPNSLLTQYTVTSADTSAGEIMIYLTSTNNGNCKAVKDSLKVTIISKPEVQIISQDSICSNLSQLNLKGVVTPGFTGTWSVDGLGSIANINDLNTYYTINPLDTLNNFITLHLSTNGTTCPSETDSLNVYFITPPEVNAGINQSFCQNENAVLSGTISSPNSGGVWSTKGTGTFVPSDSLLQTYYTPSLLDVSSGSVHLILSSLGEFGCPATKDTLLITFKPQPKADFTSTTACEENNTVFTDLSTSTSGLIYSREWYFGDGDSSLTTNPLHLYQGHGDYIVSLIIQSTNGCSDTIYKSIHVNPKPLPNFTYAISCANLPMQFHDQSFISNGAVVAWKYNFGTGDTSTIQNPNYTYYVPGNYFVQLTAYSDSGCFNDTTIQISILPTPQADFQLSPNPALAFENVKFIDKSSGNNISSWLWNFGDGEGDNNQNTNHQYTGGGNYATYLVITDGNGCIDTAYRELIIGLPPDLPSGFTPNGDGENDIFRIKGGPFVHVFFKIYNKWGEIIFETNNPNKGWAGSYKNKPSPVGVYTWVLKTELPGGRQVNKSGDVTLLR